MPWTIPPDSLRGTERCREKADLDLVETTRAYLACLAGGGIPGPTLASAWDQFYRTYTPLVFRVVRRRRGAAIEPDDLAQDVWQTIVTHLAAFRSDPARGSFRAWLLVVARHRLADRLRGDLRKIRPTTWDVLTDDIEGTEEEPTMTCERDEERSRFAGLLEQLRTRVTPLSYRVFQLRALEGQAVPDVADLVGLTADQVRARHHRTVAMLRQLAGQAEGHARERTGRIPPKFPVAAQQRSAT